MKADRAKAGSGKSIARSMVEKNEFEFRPKPMNG
jgi:hypothetical protein